MSSGQQIKYPWDKWFSKPSFKLVSGQDFTCMIHSMIVQIRNVASSRGESVSIKVDGDTITVVKLVRK
jgi:hypothetical protein